MGTRNHPLLDRHAYFVTTTTAERARIFRDPQVANLFIEGLLTLRDELGFLLLSYVVMPEHVHLIVIPGPTVALPRIMQHIKGRFARRFNEGAGAKGKVWQPRYYESIMRDERSLLAAVEYIEQNPVKAGLAPDASQYPYSSASRLTTDLEGFMSGERMAAWPG
jgi:REP element-mobilizing transposase RayT